MKDWGRKKKKKGDAVYIISFFLIPRGALSSCRRHSQAHLPGYEPHRLSGSQGWPSFVYPIVVSPHLPGEYLPRALHLRAFATSGISFAVFSVSIMCYCAAFVHVVSHFGYEARHVGKEIAPRGCLSIYVNYLFSHQHVLLDYTKADRKADIQYPLLTLF